MSDDKGKVTDKAGEIAKNIWLAGVGAYGKAVDEAVSIFTFSIGAGATFLP